MNAAAGATVLSALGYTMYKKNKVKKELDQISKEQIAHTKRMDADDEERKQMEQIQELQRKEEADALKRRQAPVAPAEGWMGAGADLLGRGRQRRRARKSRSKSRKSRTKRTRKSRSKNRKKRTRKSRKGRK